MRGLKRNGLTQAALLGHIPKHQHRPLHLAVRVPNRGDCSLHQQVATVAPLQKDLRVTLGFNCDQG